MGTILITGSNRGLGLEWVRQYAAADWRVYATCRYPDQADDLQKIASDHSNVSVHRLDVRDAGQVQDLQSRLETTALDILINNAGVYHERWGKDKLGSIDYQAWLETYQVNVLGAVRVTEALRQQLARSDRRLVLMTTSHMGSLEDITSPNDYAYRSSKAALNAVVRGLVHELKPLHIGILLVHPGWVRTRMGGPQGRYSAQESVSQMRQLIDTFRPEHSGRFVQCNGAHISW